MRLATRQLLLLWILLAFSGSAVQAAITPLRLSGPGGPTSDVPDDATLSPDGEWAVYRLDTAVDNVFRLFAVRRQGTERHELALSPAGGDLDSFVISPDSRRVVYETVILSTGAYEVWSVPIAGPAAAVRLSPDWTTGEGVESFALSSDGSRVVILGEFEADGRFELYSSPIEGPSGSATRLHPTPVTGGAVDTAEITPDGASVVFSGDIAVDNRPEIWSVPIAGPAANALRLSGAAPAGASTGGVEFRISPDSSRVVYTGEFETLGVRELWSSAVGVAGRVKLNPAVISAGDVSTNHLEIASDGARVVFFGDLRVDERLEVWSVPVAGPASAADRLNPTPVAGGEISNAYPFAVSPDGSWVALHGDLQTSGVHELWRVPISGPATAAVKVNPDLPADGDIEGDYAFSPDSDWLVFRGDLDEPGERGLWSAARLGDAGSAVSLSGSIVAGGDSLNFEVTSDSARVVFRGDLSIDGRLWLYSRAIDGSGSRALLTSELLFDDEAAVSDFVLSPDGSEVAYVADPTVTGRKELYRRRVDGSGGLEHLSGPSPTFTAVDAPRFTPDGRGVTYLADADFANADELWIADDWIFSDDFDEGDLHLWSTHTD